MTKYTHGKYKNALRIWQQNLGKSKAATLALLNGDDNPIHDNWDIICLQEPWISTKGKTQASQHWIVVYPDKDHKDAKTRSIILVNAKLDTNSWTPLKVLDSADVTAIQI
ncbi:hypothetical protein BDN72DRAFT_776683, partial [Pluteus cervinus]